MLYSIMVYGITFVVSLAGIRQYERITDAEAANNHKKKLVLKIFWILCIMVPPILVAAFRDVTVGTDYLSYRRIYESVKVYELRPYMEFKRIYGGVEYGYQFICHMVYRLGGNFLWVNGICEFVIMLFMWRGMHRYHRMLGISTTYGMFLFYMLEFSYGLNAVRFSMALAIFFYGLRFILERKPIPYILVCLIASLFHTTAIFTILFYLVNIFQHKWLSKFLKAILLIAIVLVLIYMEDLLKLFEKMPLIREYLDLEVYSINYNVQYGMGVWVYILLLLGTAVLFWNSIVRKRFEMQSVLLCTLIYIPLRFLGYYNHWISRLMMYSEVCICLLVPFLVNALQKKNNRQIIYMYYIGVGIVYYISNYVLQGYSEIYPFHWIEL